MIGMGIEYGKIQVQKLGTWHNGRGINKTSHPECLPL